MASRASEIGTLYSSCLHDWFRPSRSCLCYNSTTSFTLHLRALEPSSIMRVCFSVPLSCRCRIRTREFGEWSLRFLECITCSISAREIRRRAHQSSTVDYIILILWTANVILAVLRTYFLSICSTINIMDFNFFSLSHWALYVLYCVYKIIIIKINITKRKWRYEIFY